MRGRKPKPTALKLVTGNPGRRPLNPREPKPRRVIPSAPDHLSRRELVIWGQVSVVLDRMQVLTEADTLALARICEMVVEIVELKRNIRRYGRTQKVLTKVGARKKKPGPGDYMERQRPQVAMLQEARRALRGYLAEFGLTPSARTRLHAEIGQRSEDPVAKYFADA